MLYITYASQSMFFFQAMNPFYPHHKSQLNKFAIIGG